METSLPILVIDDSEDDRTLYRRTLKTAFGERLQFSEAANGEAGFDAIMKAEPSCVLLDYSLPGSDGLEVLRRIRSTLPYLPVIMLTGHGNETVAVEAMKEGAQNYITKAAITPEAFGRIVRTAIETCALQKRVRGQQVTVELFNHALAQDLREPVRTIQAFAAMICDGEADDQQRDNYMRYIRDAGDRMALLIDTVSTYTQLDGETKPTREVFNLNEAASAAAANLSALFQERGTKVSIAEMPLVTANRAQITQVFQNLMANAVSHSADRVHLSVDASNVDTMVRVVVRDNGPGIAAENLRQIFEPFRRLNRDNHHSGLGLAISRKIVEMHGGKIGCDSVVGEGSIFHFTVHDAGSVVSEVSKSPVTSETIPLANVLLIDDGEGDAELMRLYITAPRGMNCNFIVAHDGKEGLATIRDHSTKENPIDLILLDVNMPVMNGFEVLEEMRKNVAYNGIPVVMCSGSTWPEEKSRSLALGAMVYLVKPVRFPQLEPYIAASPGIKLTPNLDGSRSLVRVT